MIRPRMSVVSVVVLTAPADAAQSDGARRHYSKWAALTAQVSTSPSAAARALESIRAQYGLSLDLWADSTVDSTHFVLEDAPCGAVTLLFLRRLPLGIHPLSADIAIEADSPGRELHRWPMPLDSWVDGIR